MAGTKETATCTAPGVHFKSVLGNPWLQHFKLREIYRAKFGCCIVEFLRTYLQPTVSVCVSYPCASPLLCLAFVNSLSALPRPITREKLSEVDGRTAACLTTTSRSVRRPGIQSKLGLNIILWGNMGLATTLDKEYPRG